MSAASPVATPARIGWFRWKAVLPLGLFIALVVILWLLFADRLGRLAVEKGGTAALGAKVEVDRFHIALTRGQLQIGGMTVASPFDSLKNLFQADELVADIAILPLLEKKVVIDQLAAKGLRFGTPRTTSGIVASKGGGPSATSQIMNNARSWAAQPALQVPVLQLATGKLSIDSLDPRRLATVQAAQALVGRADSSRQAWTTAAQSLDVKGTADSATAFAARLQKASPTDLALINDARRELDRIKQTRDRLTALQKSINDGMKGMQQGVAGLEDARQRDYAFARSLVKLPPIDATALGWVLFGPAAVEKFQRAIYYTQLARHYMPAGLMPREDPAPQRVRMAGTDVRFPKEHTLPGFLLREAQLSFFLGEQPKAYAGTLRGLTSDPALYGRPTTLDAIAPGITAGALFDHVRPLSRDTLGGVVENIRLPELQLPSLGIRLAPGGAQGDAGTVGFGFSLVGDSLRGRWSVSTKQAAWARDAAVKGQAADLVWQVVSGIQQLDVTAELSGTLDAPRLNVHSNLDKAVADRVLAIVGDQVKGAEAKLKAQVDAAVNDQVAKAKAQVSGVASDATSKLGAQQSQLDQAQKAIQTQLARLTGGIHLP